MNLITSGNKRPSGHDLPEILQPKSKKSRLGLGPASQEEKMEELYYKIMQNPHLTFNYSSLNKIKHNFSMLECSKINEKYEFVSRVLIQPLFEIITNDFETHEVMVSVFAHHSKFIKMLLNRGELNKPVHLDCTSEILDRISALLHKPSFASKDPIFLDIHIDQGFANFPKYIWNNELISMLLKLSVYLDSQVVTRFFISSLEKYLAGSNDIEGMVELLENESFVAIPESLVAFESKLTFLFSKKDLSIAHLRRITNILKKPVFSNLLCLCVPCENLNLINRLRLKGLSVNCFSKPGANEIDAINTFLVGQTYLEFLSIDTCNLNDKGIQHIASHCPNLTSFSCANSKLSVQGFRDLAKLDKLEHLTMYAYKKSGTEQMLLPSLKTYDFGEFYFYKKEHFQRINKMDRLESLKFYCEDNDLQNDEKNYLYFNDKRFMLLKNRTNLKKLIILGSWITDLSLAHIVKEIPNLESLTLNNCDFVTTQGIHHISKLPKLKTLKITSCDQLSTQSFFGLNWKSLQKLEINRSEYFVENNLYFEKTVDFHYPKNNVIALLSIDPFLGS